MRKRAGSPLSLIPLGKRPRKRGKKRNFPFCSVWSDTEPPLRGSVQRDCATRSVSWSYSDFLCFHRYRYCSTDLYRDSVTRSVSCIYMWLLLIAQNNIIGIVQQIYKGTVPQDLFPEFTYMWLPLLAQNNIIGIVRQIYKGTVSKDLFPALICDFLCLHRIL